MSAVHVAVGAMVDAQGRVLVQQRPPGRSHAGAWEFPGGKVDPGEDVRAALVRELEEELGIQVEHARPLIALPHTYPQGSVLLDVWRIDRWTGTPHPRENQVLSWAAPSDLNSYELLPANRPIVTALRLPDLYLITPEPDRDRRGFLQHVQSAVAGGVRLVQLRAKKLPPAELLGLARDVVACAAGAAVLINGPPELAASAGAAGVHLTSARLEQCQTRPLPDSFLVAASCHDSAQLARACSIGCDFAVLGPVLATASHPDAHPLGWERFRASAAGARLPIYALGGMRPEHLDLAWRHGAQGLAMMSGLWGRHHPKG